MLYLVSTLYIIFVSQVTSQDISFMEDVKTLSELPLDKLLNLKRNFDVEKENDFEPVLNSTDRSPQALALQSKKSTKETEVYHYDDSSAKDKTSSIFQISITTLAFLAFGGYLICLLVQAVKGKNNNYQTTATQIMSAIVSANIKKSKPTRAPYRGQKRPESSYSYRRPRPKRDVLTDLDMENMYYSLVKLSEGYTKFHTEDYLHYNLSSNSFNYF